ncbi:hypothetical protein D5085_13170 [Ectothiorhodospiraceae bacterium BW-2]|nr:hypothetical protein D5085_13170 [Ectothiorhodospiraceae bacterium BW-2]
MVLVLLLIVGFVAFWQMVLTEQPERALHTIFMGRLPKPTEPGLIEGAGDLVMPQDQFQPMTITHIPNITMQERLPHPYVGPCINCHLITGGAEPGSQFKTPYGAVMESLSKNLMKMGPPIKPVSKRPHPPAGRCIKCHDIVVMVPVKKSPFIWQ